MFKHKRFPTCNSHLTQGQLSSLKRKLDFSKLGNKPLFSPFAASGAHYSQVNVEEGTKLRASAHVFAVVYKVRFLEQGAKRMEAGALKQLLERTGAMQAFEASHLCSNYKGCGHDCNPHNITLEPLEINQSRRTCHLRWALNQFLANLHPPPTTAMARAAAVRRFYAEGDRYPPLQASATNIVDNTTPFCCSDLHEPACIPFYGVVPPAIIERVTQTDQQTLDRKTKRVAELQEKKRREEEERAAKRARTHP
jgi:hypothetical protein